MNTPKLHILFSCTLGILLLIGTLLLLHASLSAHAQTGTVLYVAPDGVDSGNCTDLDAPCRTVQYAIDQASSTDEIRVASGVYTNTTVRPRDDITTAGFVAQVAYISKTVTIRGGYSPADWNTSNPEDNPTVLDAQGQGRVFYIAGSISPTLEGLFITGGSAAGLGGTSSSTPAFFNRDSGGGIYVIAATLTLSRCQIYANSTISGISMTGPGGGVYAVTATLSLYNSDVWGNTADGSSGLFLDTVHAVIDGNVIRDNQIRPEYHSLDGGTVFLYNGTVVINGNTITNNVGSGISLSASTATISMNTVVSNTGYRGGGIRVEESQCTIVNNVIYNNNADEGGGIGVFVDGPGFAGDQDVVIDDNTIMSNTTDGGGGGIAVHRGQHIKITDNTISANWAAQGGGIYLDTGNAVISGNTIQANGASAGGGGVLVLMSSTVLNQNVVLGNTARFGAGLFLSTNTATLDQNIVRSNTASNHGGGILLGIDATLTNTLIADNTAPQGSAVYIEGCSPKFFHTTLANNIGDSGIYVEANSGMSNIAVLTNTILVSHSVGVSVAEGSAVSLQATLWGQDEWANTSNWNATAVITHTDDYVGLPDFTADYHIGTQSAAMDRGVLTGVDQDIDSEYRPFGNLPDLGADEVVLDLSISKTGPPTGWPGDLITYTLAVSNDSSVAVFGIVVTDELPVNAHYVGGGSLVPGNIVSWTIGELASNSHEQLQFVITTTQNITNDHYGVSCYGGGNAIGAQVVVTTIDWRRIYLPLLFKQYP